MRMCKYDTRVEKWFDGQIRDPEVQQHLQGCAQCRHALVRLEKLRENTAAAMESAEITGTQFPAFFSGIVDRLDAPVPRRGRVWAILSLVTAALIVAISAFLVVSGGPGKVDATVVESCSSELEGATVTSYDTGDGVTTVWVTVAQEDVW